MKNENAPDMSDNFKFIRMYSQTEAIRNGVLINLSARFPVESQAAYGEMSVVCTDSVWALIQCAAENQNTRIGANAVVRDVLQMSLHGIGTETGTSVRSFNVAISSAASSTSYQLKCHLGHGDNGDPVVTILMPDED